MEEVKFELEYVTADLMDVALRSIGIKLNNDTINKIIDIVELIEKTKGKTTLRDIVALEADWEKPY